MSALPRPYFEANGITLYHGDCREIAPLLPECDAVITDPPYGETSLDWDTWPKGWPALATALAPQLWCFGSLRMFLDNWECFSGWKLAQDIVWERHNGSSLHSDRFRRVHELAIHLYRGEWGTLYRSTPTIPGVPRSSGLKRGKKPEHFGGIEQGKSYFYGEERIMRSVIPVASCHGYATNETQKPEGIVAPLLTYSVPPGGCVADFFAGSGTTLFVARAQGKRAIGIEKRESQCAAIAARLAQQELFTFAPAAQ